MLRDVCLYGSKKGGGKRDDFLRGPLGDPAGPVSPWRHAGGSGAPSVFLASGVDVLHTSKGDLRGSEPPGCLINAESRASVPNCQSGSLGVGDRQVGESNHRKLLIFFLLKIYKNAYGDTPDHFLLHVDVWTALPWHFLALVKRSVKERGEEEGSSFTVGTRPRAQVGLGECGSGHTAPEHRRAPGIVQRPQGPAHASLGRRGGAKAAPSPCTTLSRTPGATPRFEGARARRGAGSSEHLFGSGVERGGGNKVGVSGT